VAKALAFYERRGAGNMAAAIFGVDGTSYRSGKRKRTRVGNPVDSRSSRLRTALDMLCLLGIRLALPT
jgi:hypothetical protein